MGTDHYFQAAIILSGQARLMVAMERNEMGEMTMRDRQHNPDEARWDAGETSVEREPWIFGRPDQPSRRFENGRRA